MLDSASLVQNTDVIFMSCQSDKPKIDLDNRVEYSVRFVASLSLTILTLVHFLLLTLTLPLPQGPIRMPQIPLRINNIPHPTLKHLDLCPHQHQPSQLPQESNTRHRLNQRKKKHTRKPPINPPIPEHPLPHLRLHLRRNTHDKRTPRTRHKRYLPKSRRERREEFLGELRNHSCVSNSNILNICIVYSS